MTSKTPTFDHHTHQKLIHHSSSFDNPICNNNNNNNNNVIEQASIDYLKVKTNKKLYKSESKEDVQSETGTYTIEIDRDSPNNRKSNGVNIEIINDDLELRKAAIDHTFGISLLNNQQQQQQQKMSNSDTNIEFLIDECRPHNLVTSSYGNLQDYENDEGENMQLIVNNGGGGADDEIEDDAESFNNKNNLNKSSTSNTSNSNSSSSSNRKAKKYSSRIKKTLTYDIIKNGDGENQNNLSINIDDGDDDEEDDDSSHVNNNNNNKHSGDDTDGLSERTAATGTTAAAMSLCTDVLLGDTKDLINKLNEKKQQIRARTKSHIQSITPPKLNFGNETTRTGNEEIEKFSTRAIVNDSELFHSNQDDTENIETVDSVTSDEYTEYDDDSQRDGSHRGGLAFQVDLARTTSLPPQANAGNSFNTTKQTAHHYIYELKRPRSKTETASNISTSTSNLTKSVNNTQITEQSLGAKIQQKAKHNANQMSPQHQHYQQQQQQQQQPQLKSIIRRSSLNEKNGTSNTAAAAAAATNNPTMTSSAILSSNNLQMQTNRTLFLRQQSAKAKREALSSSNSNQPPPFTVPISSTNTTTKPRSANSASTTRRSVDTNHSMSSTSAASTARSKNPSQLGVSTKTKPNSRSQSPSVVSQPQSILSAVNNHHHTAAREAFQRRKNYDPLKAVEDERIKRKLKHQPHSNNQDSYQTPITTTSTAAHTATPSSHSNRLRSQTQEESPNSLGSIDSVSSSVCNDLSAPIEKLKTNISNKQYLNSSFNNLFATSTSYTSNKQNKVTDNKLSKSILTLHQATTTSKTAKQPSSTVVLRRPLSSSSTGTKPPPHKIRHSMSVLSTRYDEIDENEQPTTAQQQDTEINTYETLLKSTVQRLCIRLIQMSTSVLDKIGDQSTSKLNEDAIKLGNNELERMQNLAKLVHSMQLVNEHVQIIDSTLFSANKPDERYLNLA